MNKLTLLVHFTDEPSEEQVRRELSYSVLSTVADIRLNNTTKSNVDRLSSGQYLVQVLTDVRLLAKNTDILSLIEYRLMTICGRRLSNISLTIYDPDSNSEVNIRRDYA